MTGATAIRAAVAACVLVCVSAGAAMASTQRVLPPEFEGEYAFPQPSEPAGRMAVWAIADVALLVAAMGVAAWMVLARRSRGGVLVVLVASLMYFGFLRGGCVCPVGAVQNFSAGLLDPHAAVGMVVVAFLVLPLAFTLLWGRAFCGGVCPLGAVQDLTILRPLRVPAWLEHGLGLVAWAVLALAVLLAATGSGYLVCRFDPYVALFRLAPVGKWVETGTWAGVAGRIEPLLFLAAVLVVGLLVARPFCRYICPLGALMRLCSPLARRRVTITPDRCIRCRLCESACPVGAILPPTSPVGAARQRRDRQRILGVLVLLPVLVVVGAVLGYAARHTLARANFEVALAERIEREHAGAWAPSEPVEAFHAGQDPMDELNRRADYVRGQFAVGAPLAGGFLGMVVGLKLLSLAVRRRRDDWTADPAKCLACGRCFASCPIEQQQRKGTSAAPASQAIAAHAGQEA